MQKSSPKTDARGDPTFAEMFGPAPYDASQYVSYGSMAEAVWLMQTLDPAGPHNIAYKHPSDGKGMGGRTFAAGTDWMEIARFGNKLNKSGYNVYLMANTPKPRSPNKRLAETDIAAINAIVGDIDVLRGETREKELKAIAARIDALPLQPLRVRSGNGWQFYWLLEAPLPASPANVLRAKRIGKAVARHIDGDPMQSVEHVFRAPGTMNFPDEGKQARNLKQQRSSLGPTDAVRRFSLEELEAAFPPQGPDDDVHDSEAFSQAEKQTKAALDMDAVAGVGKWDDLPQGLRDRFDAMLDAHPNARRRWEHGEKLDGTVEASGHRNVAAMANHMVSFGGFDVTGFGMVLQIWSFAAGRKGHHDDEGLGNADRRSIIRAWTKATLRQDPGEADDAFDETGDRTAGEAGEAGEAREETDDDHDDDDDDGKEEDIDPALLKVPGLAGDIADFLEDTSVGSSRVHAVAASIAVIGAIIQREVFTEYAPTGAHLYQLIISTSGGGKQHLLDGVKLLLDEATPTDPLHDGFKQSAPMLLTKLQERPALLQVVDEFADKMGGLRQKTGVNEAIHLSEAYRELWGVSTAVYKPGEALSRRSKPITRPALSLFAANTIHAFIEMLTSTSIANGLLNRMLVIPSYKRPPVRKALRSGVLAVPPPLKQKCHDLFTATHGMTLTVPNPQSALLPRHLVRMTPEAIDMDYANRQFQEGRMALSDEHPEMMLHARHAETIKRIALIVACGRTCDPAQASVEADDMRFAHGLVAWSIEQAVTLVRRHMMENETQRGYLKIRRLIFGAGPKGITYRNLLRKLKGALTKKQVDDVLLMLVGAGQITDQITDRKTTTGGRPSRALKRTRGTSKMGAKKR